ncbi:cbb3-type cytochrome oxidase assembly protein CcoS [Avrilella dinanensis]|uniref:Cbb3-type cytochrome oxidase assembly protein CcoS n=1 Tax=Avrilella dinanensis TaxID=2008672 RepID=A0A2M9R7P1_9FLAO|nr:cbb3-type cytochrome oxidase assembly protein CcoS [Avrilella dinanensis]PJR04892.1 cbb3-type cytochrome oxidase assembly protein CcoS [Avrilella dinanensis]
MSIIYILICISVFVAAVFLFLFISSVKSGQFDDNYTPSVRVLFENKTKKSKEKEQSTKYKQSNSN